MRKTFTAQEKLYAVQDYLNGKGSQKSIAKALEKKYLLYNIGSSIIKA